MKKSIPPQNTLLEVETLLPLKYLPLKYHSQALKFHCNVNQIAHQARSSITPQVKIKNWRKGKLCGNGSIYLQNIATPAFPREQVSWHQGYQPICPGKPLEQHRRDVFNFLCHTDALAPLAPQHPPHWKPEDARQKYAQRPNPKGQTNTLPPSNNLAWPVVLFSLQSPYPPDKQWT